MASTNLKTETILKSDRRNVRLSNLELLSNEEVQDHLNFLPEGSIFSGQSDFSSAIADVMRIRSGAVIDLNLESNSNDLHFCRSLKCLVRAGKSFHLLVVPGQDITVFNTGASAIYVWISHFQETSQEGEIKKGKTHAKPRITVHPGQKILL